MFRFVLVFVKNVLVGAIGVGPRSSTPLIVLQALETFFFGSVSEAAVGKH